MDNAKQFIKEYVEVRDGNEALTVEGEDSAGRTAEERRRYHVASMCSLVWLAHGLWSMRWMKSSQESQLP